MTASHKLDDTFAALADQTRRALLAKLAEGEARVTDLAAPFAISLNSVSKHIRRLERAGLVHRRLEGREHFLCLSTRPLNEVAAWIEAQRRAWSDQLAALHEMLQGEGDVAKLAGRRGLRRVKK
jgi:DNA-binding transcriptional ArsR family regulator